jgi:hypothetical protein
VFRKMDPWGNVDRPAVTMQSVNFESRSKKRHDRFQEPHFGIPGAEIASSPPRATL